MTLRHPTLRSSSEANAGWTLSAAANLKACFQPVHLSAGKGVGATLDYSLRFRIYPSFPHLVNDVYSLRFCGFVMLFYCEVVTQYALRSGQSIANLRRENVMFWLEKSGQGSITGSEAFDMLWIELRLVLIY